MLIATEAFPFTPALSAVTEYIALEAQLTIVVEQVGQLNPLVGIQE
jgi:hypothetical protein